METIKITDVKEEKIQIGKQIFQSKSSSYTKEKVDQIYKTIKDLSTEKLKQDFTQEELFFLSNYDFWVYGNSISEEIYFHFLYKTHEEKMEYMTHRTRLNCMKELNPKEYAHIFNNKYETYLRFKDYYLRDIVKIEKKEDYGSFLKFVEKHKSFVVKPTSSHIGIGVKKITIREDEDQMLLFNSLLKEGKENAKDCFNNDSSFLLEEIIEQDEQLAQIHPYSVNSIRVTTLKCNGGIKILYPWFKVGTNKSFVTSAAFGTYDAGIDPTNGVVITDGFKENGVKDAIHPLTGIPFKGYQIPKWNDLLSMANTLANVVPEVNYIGWDFVLTPKGWCIMEGNYAGDFMWQMFNERGFRKEFESLTGITIKKEFWWQ